MATLYNLARMSTATTGTGTITLGSAVSGYLTFALAGVADGTVVDYGISDGSNSEVGTGTYTASGTTLTRTVTKSTNSNAAITLSGTAQVYVTARAETITPTLDFRNILFANGGMEVWQRGAGGAASFAIAASTPGYTADRWYFTNNATQASVVSQQAGLTTNSRWSLRALRNSGQTGTGVMRLEYALTTDECFTLRGQIITWQAVLSAGANWSPSSGNLSVNAYFGTGTEGRRGAGTYTGETNPLTTTIALTPGGSAAQSTFTGASAVATNVTQGCLQFSWTPVGTAGAADNVNIDDVQLEIGIYPTTFERPTFQELISECQRHYTKTFDYSTAPAQNAGTAGALAGWSINVTPSANSGSAISWSFPVQMRVDPTMTGYNPSAGNANMRGLGSSSDTAVGTGGFTAGVSGVRYVAQALATQDVVIFHMQADAGL